MRDKRTLRERVRQTIRSGALPHRRPDRTWGGPGTGIYCVICRVPVTPDETELELEFAGDADSPPARTYHMHVSCFAAWGAELENIELAAAAPPSSGQAPLGVLRDARVRDPALLHPPDSGKIAGRDREPAQKRGPG